MTNLLPAHECGRLLENPVVVNDPRTGKVVYLPPNVPDVKPLMTELVEYIKHNDKKIDALILAGIFHKQMVIIHPFMDGNGRTTRLVTKVLLAAMGLNTFNLFSFENYYNQNVTQYFLMVGLYGDYYELKDGGVDFTMWLEYFTSGIIDELLRVEKQLPKSSNPDNELKKYHIKILEIIKEKGFIKDADYALVTDRAKATRALDFAKLIELGLIEMKGRGKATYYIFKEN